MTNKNWREATADLILKVSPIWFTNAGIRLALTILIMPVVVYVLYPSVVDAVRQIAGNLHP